MTTDPRWEALQSRFAAGETLSAGDERTRLEGARGDVLAERELALFAELRERGEGVAEVPDGLIDRVLAALGSRPRLHLLAPGEVPPAAPRNSRRRYAALAVAAVTVLAAGAGTFALLRPTSEPARVAAVAPSATPRLARAELVLASGDVTAPGDARVGGRPLASGDRVTTGSGRACLGVDPGIDVCLGARSELHVESLRVESIRIRVTRGTAIAALAPREAGQVFSLVAGDVDVTAHGTVFAVERRADEQVDVVVMEGAVEVSGRGAPAALVPAHSRLALAKLGPGEPSAIGRGDEARFWALLGARELWAKPELGVLEVASSEPGLEIAVDRAAPLTLPFRSFVPAGRRAVALRTASGDEVTTSVDVVAGETFVLEPSALLANRATAEAATAEATTEATTAVPSAATLLARARRELGSGNAPGALALYETLRKTHPTSPEARTVLVTIGKLELDLKRPARALASFDAYLASPGPLAPEALGGKIRALRALGRSADEQRAIETYLARHPDGFEAPLLAQRLQVLSGR